MLDFRPHEVPAKALNGWTEISNRRLHLFYCTHNISPRTFSPSLPASLYLGCGCQVPCDWLGTINSCYAATFTPVFCRTTYLTLSLGWLGSVLSEFPLLASPPGDVTNALLVPKVCHEMSLSFDQGRSPPLKTMSSPQATPSGSTPP